jgi:hypothetical protein
MIAQKKEQQTEAQNGRCQSRDHEKTGDAHENPRNLKLSASESIRELLFRCPHIPQQGSAFPSFLIFKTAHVACHTNCSY